MCKNDRVCFNSIIWLITIKVKVKMKIRSYRYNINRPRTRHGRKYTKDIMCQSTMMVTCIKQYLSNI